MPSIMAPFPLKSRSTIMNDNRIEMKRLVLSIERNLPNVAAAGSDLRALSRNHAVEA
jgi:hypothetical protein